MRRAYDFRLDFFRRGDRDADSSLTDPGIRLVHCYGKFLLNVSRRRLIQKIQDLIKLPVEQISELTIGLRSGDESPLLDDRVRFWQMTCFGRVIKTPGREFGRGTEFSALIKIPFQTVTFQRFTHQNTMRHSKSSKNVHKPDCCGKRILAKLYSARLTTLSDPVLRLEASLPSPAFPLFRKGPGSSCHEPPQNESSFCRTTRVPRIFPTYTLRILKRENHPFPSAAVFSHQIP